MEHFSSLNSGADQRKRSSPTMEHFFSSNSSRDLRSDAHQSQIIGRDTVKLLGGYIPPGFRHPCLQVNVSKGAMNHFDRVYITANVQ